MKTLFCIVLFWNVSLISGLAQDGPVGVKIEWGELSEKDAKFEIHEVAGYDGTDLYVTKVNKRGYSDSRPSLASYDRASLEREVFEKIKLKGDERKQKFQFAVYFQDSLYIFFFSNLSDLGVLSVQTFDESTLQPRDDLRRVLQVDFSRKGALQFREFRYQLSEDSSKLLVYYNIPDGAPQDDRFGLCLFGRGMKRLWSRDIQTPYQERMFSPVNFLVSDSGDVYMLAQFVNATIQSADRPKKPLLTYVVFAVLEGGDFQSSYVLKGEDVFLLRAAIAFAPEGRLMCAGLYGRDGFNMAGSYVLQFDARLEEVLFREFYEFDSDFLKKDWPHYEGALKKAKRKGYELGLHFYDYLDILPTGDGNAFLLAEQFRYVSLVGSGNQRRTAYRRDNIFVMRITPKGHIRWVQKVPKRQLLYQRNDGRYSYLPLVRNDELYLFFNTLSGASDQTLTPFDGGVSNSQAVMVVIDLQGDQRKEVLFAGKDVQVVFLPKYSRQISNEEVFLLGEYGKYDRAGWLRFED